MAASQTASSNLPSVLRVLLDTMVVLDWLLDRKPWVDEAGPLWQARDQGRIITYIPASVLTDIFYIGRRIVGTDAALVAVDRALALEVVPVEKATLLRARSLPGADFEDNVGMACAESERLDFIVTRDVVDFLRSPIRAIQPAELARQLPTP